jgi:RNA polymerase sigma-70 factor (ECF subfamily)
MKCPSLRRGPVPSWRAGMKRASPSTGPLQDGSGSAARPAVHDGVHPDVAPLLSGLRLGAPAAVKALLDRYHGKVYGLAMSILMNPSDAEEAVQGVFLTVVRKAGRFQGTAAHSSWIYRICVNSCLMRLRTGQRTKTTVPIQEFLPVFTKEGAHAKPVEGWSREDERRLSNKEIGQVIGGFAEELPEEYRVLFALCDAQGFSCEETAQIMGLTVAAVKFRLHLARLYLRERLGRYLRNGKGG